ncbi:MAG: hypothetical protein KDK66_08475 [Deltaproteobacteria bacterium]|nr:hypothetical protein [Deltaproteobacteria bacterium]
MMIQSQTTTQIQSLNPLYLNPQPRPISKPAVSTSHFNCGVGAYASRVRQFVGRVNQWANSQLTNPNSYTGRSLQRGYGLYTARRQANSRPTMSFGQYQDRIVNKARRILNGPESYAVKMGRLVTLGRMAGIGPLNMMRMAKQIKAVDSQAAGSLNNYQHNQLNNLSAELASAQSQYGCHSPQAMAVKQKMAALTSTVNRATQRYESQYQGQKIETAKPKKKKGFFGKLKSAFKKIGKGLTKVVRIARPFLPLIPGVGPMAAMAADGFLMVSDAISTKGKSLANVGMTYLQNKFPALGGVKVGA